MRAAAALLSGVAAAVVAALLLGWLGHGLGTWSASAALAAGLIAASVVRWLVPDIPARKPRTGLEWLMIGVFACASARAFFWLLYAAGDWWKVLSPNNLGDLSLHVALIRWLGVSPHWWPASPILAGDPLRYPPGSDLFNALLLLAGVPMVQGLLWCGLVGSLLTGYALWRWGGAVALAALLFNGGFAGIILLHGGDPDAVTEWKNLFLSLFVTQRGFLYALPAGLLLLAAWREENFPAPPRIVLPLPLQGMLLACLPLFSVHAALVLGVMMAGLFLAVPSARKRFLLLAAMALPPMVFFGWLVTSGAGGPSALHSLGWHPGWMGDGSFRFWLLNFGISLPLGLFLCLVLFRKGADAEARAFVWPAALLFASCLLFRFAPWPWDNMKIMLWSWLITAPYIWSLLLRNLHPLLRAASIVLLFGSGAATLVAGLDGKHGYELARKSSLDQAAMLLRDLPTGAVIACAPEYNHPVLLSGHPVVCGYEGHLWSHGLDYKQRWADLDRIMKGDPGWSEQARQMGVAAIYWSDLEAKRWPGSKLPWAKEKGSSVHPVE